MIFLPGTDLPLTSGKNTEIAAVEGAIKYHFFHGQWKALESLSEEIDSNKLSCLVKGMLGIALKFYGSKESDSNKAECLIKKAIDQGLETDSLFKIMLFNTYITSARVELILGDEDSAVQDYKKAFEVLSVDSPQFFISSRLFNDLIDLGYFDRAAELMRKKDKASNIESQKNIKIKPSNFAKVILIAGMRHSGSTALFNIIRFAGLLAGLDVHSGYSEKVSVEKIELEKHDLILLKTHEKRDDILALADIVITTRRDLRDTVASGKRREFNITTKLGIIEYAKYNRLLHEIWSSKSDYEFVYEDFMKQPERVVEILFSFLGFELDLVKPTLKRVEDLPTDQYQRTLLSPTHITDKERKLTFRDSLTKEELDVINKQHENWLKDYGYLV